MTDLRLSFEPDQLPSNKKIQTDFLNQMAEIGIQPTALSKQDYQELFKLLNHHLAYPDSDLAEIHRTSNQLGEIDMKIQK